MLPLVLPLDASLKIDSFRRVKQTGVEGVAKNGDSEENFESDGIRGFQKLLPPPPTRQADGRNVWLVIKNN